jgi:hypothetical protein
MSATGLTVRINALSHLIFFRAHFNITLQFTIRPTNNSFTTDYTRKILNALSISHHNYYTFHISVKIVLFNDFVSCIPSVTDEGMCMGHWHNGGDKGKQN